MLFTHMLVRAIDEDSFPETLFFRLASDGSGLLYDQDGPTSWRLSPDGKLLAPHGTVDGGCELHDLTQVSIDIHPESVLGADMDGSRTSWFTGQFFVSALVPVIAPCGGVESFRRYALDSGLDHATAHAVAAFVRKHVARFDFARFELVSEDPWFA